MIVYFGYFYDASDTGQEEWVEQAFKKAFDVAALHHAQRSQLMGTEGRVYESDDPWALDEATDISLWPRANMT